MRLNGALGVGRIVADRHAIARRKTGLAFGFRNEARLEGLSRGRLVGDDLSVALFENIHVVFSRPHFLHVDAHDRRFCQHARLRKAIRLNGFAGRIERPAEADKHEGNGRKKENPSHHDASCCAP